MSAVATRFTKLQIGAAATAMAAAAVLTPAAVAQARPDLVPSSPVSHIFDTGPSLGPIQLSQDVPWWWLGSGPNPNTPSALIAIQPSLPGTTILAFQPLSLLPGFIQPLFGWFNSINLGICVAGLGVSVGPYGTVSVKSGSC